jgi:hypothetical protein
MRQLLMSFPQTTAVANELDCPDDGTDPTGFFNDEFYVSLKPYDDSAWQGEIHTKVQLIEAVQRFRWRGAVDCSALSGATLSPLPIPLLGLRHCGQVRSPIQTCYGMQA